MSLKEQIEGDVNNVFMSPADFAEEISVNGKKVPAIIDDDQLEGYLKYGIQKGGRLLFLRAVDFPTAPAPGAALMLGTEKWVVESCTSVNGILQIILGRYGRR